jgi:hypothetical protein
LYRLPPFDFDFAAQGFDSVNSPGLNAALLSFLWRLVLPEQLGLAAMLWQLGPLALFHKVGGRGEGLGCVGR